MPEDAGQVRCQTSDDCAPPNPYCSPTLARCVQCTADLNCFGVGLVCDQDLGVCTNCRSNADCYAPASYCSKASKGCVECLADANCGKQGIKCMSGLCGSCGDGICSDNERNGVFGPCNDCFMGCPKTDLRSKTGDDVSSEPLSSTDGQFTTSCGPPQGPAATFAWTAPDSGSYTFTVSGDATLSIYDTNCAGQAFSCSNYYAGLSLSKGQKVAIVVGSSTPAGGKYSLSINGTSNTTMCNPMFCPVGLNGEAPCCLGDMTCGFVDPTFGCSTMTAPPGSAGSAGSAGTTGLPPDGTPRGGNGSGAAPGTIGGTGTGGRLPQGTGGARAGATSSNLDGGEDTHHRSTTTSGGCGCSVPGDDESPAGALASLAAAGLLAFARRRRGAAASR